MEAFFTSQASIEADRSAAGRRYLEFLRVPDLSAGLYVLEAGAVDLAGAFPRLTNAELAAVPQVALVLRARGIEP